MNFSEAIKELDDLYEARRVISDIDTLYHYTNPTPFVKIFTEDCLRGDIHTKAVCLTTDKDYKIYGYPCGIQLSREMLIQDGYKLVEFDDFAGAADAPSESEERIYGNISNITKYVTAVHINWDNIAIVQSSEGYRVADAKYMKQGEFECYDLMLSQFRFFLMRLRMKGIEVIETGDIQYGKYWLDDTGRLHLGGKLMAFN